MLKNNLFDVLLTAKVLEAEFSFLLLINEVEVMLEPSSERKFRVLLLHYQKFMLEQRITQLAFAVKPQMSI